MERLTTGVTLTEWKRPFFHEILESRDLLYCKQRLKPLIQIPGIIMNKFMNHIFKHLFNQPFTKPIRLQMVKAGANKFNPQ